MSTEKRRKRRKLNDGSYSTIHEETSSDLVLRSDGTTVEAIIQSLISGKLPYHNKYGQNCGAAADIVETSIVTGTFTDHPTVGGIDGQGTVITIFYADGWVKQFWFAPYDTSIFYRAKANGDYSDWRRMYDTTFKPTPTEIGAVYDMRRSLSTDDLNNTNYPYPYMASMTPEYAAAIGLPSSWFHIINFRHQDNNGFNAQIAISLNTGNTQIYARTSVGGSWMGWVTVPTIQYSTNDIGSGSSLTTGCLYCVYE